MLLKPQNRTLENGEKGPSLMCILPQFVYNGRKCKPLLTQPPGLRHGWVHVSCLSQPLPSPSPQNRHVMSQPSIRGPSLQGGLGAPRGRAGTGCSHYSLCLGTSDTFLLCSVPCSVRWACSDLRRCWLSQPARATDPLPVFSSAWVTVKNTCAQRIMLRSPDFFTSDPCDTMK